MAHHQGYAHRFGDKVTQNHENNHLEKQDNFTSTPKKPINNTLLSHKSREETQKTSALSHPTPLFSKSRSLSRFRTRAYTPHTHYAHSKLLHFLPSPFTGSNIHLKVNKLSVNITHILGFTSVKANHTLPSPSTSY